MSSAKNVEIEIPCLPEFVVVPRRAAEELAERIGFAPSEVDEIKLAVGEACSNAVKYSGPEKCKVRVSMRVRDDRLEISVTNGGSEFVPDGRSRKSLREEMREGGLGLYLIDKVMDELKIRHDGGENIITMAKKLPYQPK